MFDLKEAPKQMQAAGLKDAKVTGSAKKLLAAGNGWDSFKVAYLTKTDFVRDAKSFLLPVQELQKDVPYGICVYACGSDPDTREIRLYPMHSEENRCCLPVKIKPEIRYQRKLFSKDRAEKYFAHQMVVFFAGGTGNPYFSTDTAAVLRAVEIEADGILLAKAIDGVYDSDPRTNPDARKYDEISIEEVIEKNLLVVDMTASILARDNKMPMWVFALNEKDSIVNAIKGQFNGTKVTVS